MSCVDMDELLENEKIEYLDMLCVYVRKSSYSERHSSLESEVSQIITNIIFSTNFDSNNYVYGLTTTFENMNKMLNNKQQIKWIINGLKCVLRNKKDVAEEWTYIKKNNVIYERTGMDEYDYNITNNAEVNHEKYDYCMIFGIIYKTSETINEDNVDETSPWTYIPFNDWWNDYEILMDKLKNKLETMS
jgi:hypothetical protein